jgi:hypothetical protein
MVGMESAIMRLGLEDRQARLTENLMGEDELGVVVRAHIHIEHELTEFIKARLYPPTALEAIRLDYSGRIRLALTLGLPPELKPALQFVGTLRNKFAHQLDSAIDKEDADSFESVLGRLGKPIVDRAFQQLEEEWIAAQRGVPLTQNDPKTRVTLYFVAVWSAVAVVTMKSKGIGA